jgi:hypothetical protein
LPSALLVSSLADGRVHRVASGGCRYASHQLPLDPARCSLRTSIRPQRARLVVSVQERHEPGGVISELVAIPGGSAHPYVSPSSTFTRSISPRAAVEKSPENAGTDAALDRLAASYPQARFLHLTRHPVTTQRSMLVHWEARTGAPVTPHLAAAFLYEWYEVHLRIKDFGRIVESSRYYRVQAEQILNSPEPHMRSIAS